MEIIRFERPRWSQASRLPAPVGRPQTVVVGRRATVIVDPPQQCRSHGEKNTHVFASVQNLRHVYLDVINAVCSSYSCVFPRTGTRYTDGFFLVVKTLGNRRRKMGGGGRGRVRVSAVRPVKLKRRFRPPSTHLRPRHAKRHVFVCAQCTWVVNTAKTRVYTEYGGHGVRPVRDGVKPKNENDRILWRFRVFRETNQARTPGHPPGRFITVLRPTVTRGSTNIVNDIIIIIILTPVILSERRYRVHRHATAIFEFHRFPSIHEQFDDSIPSSLSYFVRTRTRTGKKKTLMQRMNKKALQYCRVAKRV